MADACLALVVQRWRGDQSLSILCNVWQGAHPVDVRASGLTEEWDADLLVLGSSARSWLSAMFVETTMLHVVRHVDRPIFVGA